MQIVEALEAGLRTVLREYLHALDTGDEFVAGMLARCTFGPHAGPAVLLIPLARLPATRGLDRRSATGTARRATSSPVESR
jgi:hypothetical protein